MSRIVVAAVLAMAACAFASEVHSARTPARVALEQLSQAERKNSCISVEFESSDSDAVWLGRQVEREWNSGHCDKALAQLGDLEARVGDVAIGNSWRKPVPTLETNLWGRDVRIGNRDSLVQLAFDCQNSSGNLFVALRRPEIPHFSVCISTDRGSTWDETYTWSGSPPTAIGAAVFLNHFFVVYNSPTDDSRHIRLRRFRCTDGVADTFPQGGGDYVVPCTLAVGDTMREVSVVSNPNSNRLYIVTLVSDGSVLVSLAGVNAMSWTKRPTGITSGARGGLDATVDQRSDMDRLFLCCYDTSDTMRVYNGDGQRLAQPSGMGTISSISTYLDTVICVFEDETSSPQRVRYAGSSDGGYTWMIGTLSDSSIAADAPAVATLDGGEFAAAYRQDGPTRGLLFCRRTDSGPWCDPVSIADNEPYWSRPGIKCLDASGAFGVAYLSDTSPVVRGAYFDRSDWVYGIAEGRRQTLTRASPATVVRRVLFQHEATNRKLQAASLLDISGRRMMDLHPGVNEISRLSPGLYFVREAQAQAIRKIVIAR